MVPYLAGGPLFDFEQAQRHAAAVGVDAQGRSAARITRTLRATGKTMEDEVPAHCRSWLNPSGNGSIFVRYG